MTITPLAPITPTSAICMGCSNHMRVVIEKYKNGKLSRVMFYCDNCKYGHEPSMIHAMGQPAKYVPLLEPEPITKDLKVDSGG
jgi:C4-type Zn-finger protein